MVFNVRLTAYAGRLGGTNYIGTDLYLGPAERCSTLAAAETERKAENHDSCENLKLETS